MFKPTLSAIITTHSEGLLAHKTMQSVFCALEKIEKQGYSYEIIIHIDNGDKTTIEYFNRYKDDKRIKIIESSFGDTGPSRNKAVQEASGKYVAFLDGDDLITPNWYLECINLLEKSPKNTIVCPNAILTFGNDSPNVLTIQHESSEKDIITLIGENCWSSVLASSRENFLNHPYRRLGSGYSHEDYLMNVEMIHAGYHFIPAKDTALFYRRSASSRLSQSNKEYGTIPYANLFAFDDIKKLNIGNVEIQDARVRLREKGRKIYKSIRNNEKINVFITPVAKVVKKALNYKTPAKVPNYVIENWKLMNRYDSELYPHEYLINGVIQYYPEVHLGIGKAYQEISQKINHLPDYVFVVPWIVRGGADKVLFNYIKAMQEIDSGIKITVISTLQANNTWAKELPANVDYIDFGNLARGLVPTDQDILFSRLIIQLKAKRLHIINSEFGYIWANKHQSLIKNQNYKLNVSLFAYEYIKGSNNKGVWSYDCPYLFNIYPVVNKIYTDNKNIIDYAVKKNAFDPDKFNVHYQPVVGDYRNCEQKDHKKFKIMWAGRVVPVKLPEVLKKVAKKLNASEYTIDVYGEMGPMYKKDFFGDCASVVYHGVFDGFSSLPTEESDVLLYTSLNDGVPNIILEAAMAGLPIIASNDGGVGEVIKNKDTGLLVEDPFNVDGYIEAIEYAKKHNDEMKKYAENAQNLLKKQHSWKKFVEQVKKDLF